MPKVSLIEDAAPHRADLPYTIELHEPGAAPVVLAACRNSGLAYAAYYAAVRDYFGRKLVLNFGGARLTSNF